MRKEILEIVKNISLWGGDVYKLAALVADKQRELDEIEFGKKPEGE